jgi:Tfp pilus assembly protein PilO
MQQNLLLDKCAKSLLVPLLQKEVSEEKAEELAATLARTVSIVCLLHLEPLRQQLEELRQSFSQLQQDRQYLQDILENLGSSAIDNRLEVENHSSQILADIERHFCELSEPKNTPTPKQCV